MPNEYFRIKDQGLFNELQAYSIEVQASSAHRRAQRRSQLVGVGVFLLIAGFILHAAFITSLSTVQHAKTIAVDDLTANPSALLTETSKSVLKMAKTGQIYIVQVSVKPL